MSRPPLMLIARDLALIVLAVFAWRLSHVLQDAASGWRWPSAIAAALLLTLCGVVVHEWGHLLGAWCRRARVAYAATPFSLLLFRFDSARNDRRQFLAMAYGGFAASLAYLLLMLTVLRWRYYADALALALIALGVLATLVLEVPLAWRVRRGAPLPRGAAYVGETPD